MATPPPPPTAPLAAVDLPPRGEPDGARTAAEPCGAPLVVLVHGALDRSASFLKAARLLDDLHVVAYDRRGYGRSLEAGPAADQVEVHVEDLLGLIESSAHHSAAPGSGVVLVGHSYGGVVALAAACRRPDLVRSVGAFEAPMPWLPWWPPVTAGAHAVARALAGGHPADAVDAFMERMVGLDRWEALPEATRQRRRAEGPALVGDLASIRREPPFDVAAVGVPVVVGCGTASMEHQLEHAPKLAEALPSGELWWVEGGRHGSHASHPEDFAAYVRRVVAAASGPRGG